MKIINNKIESNGMDLIAISKQRVEWDTQWIQKMAIGSMVWTIRYNYY